MNILNTLKCAVLGHQYRTHQAFTSYARRVVCDRCDGDWAMNDNIGVIVRWNSQFHALYTHFGHEVRPVQRKKP